MHHKLDFRNIKVNLLETLAFDCNVGLLSIVGACRPPAPRRLAVQVLLTARGRWTSGAEHLDGLMSRISPKCSASLRCCRRRALSRPCSGVWAEASR
jgi:hypothetical protein